MKNRMRKLERITSCETLREHNSPNNLVFDIRISHESNEISHTIEDITMIRRLDKVMEFFLGETVLSEANMLHNSL